MSNDKFRVWEFKNELPKDADIRVTFGLNNSASGAGSADPSAIDFSWHQKVSKMLSNLYWMGMHLLSMSQKVGVPSPLSTPFNAQ